MSFDPSKESIHVMGRAHPVGEGFKILGIQYDLQLLMGDCIDSVCADASWKLKAILRVRRFHSDTDMVIMYKARLLSFIEYRTPAVYHACTSRLIKIDKLQDAFLRALGVSREDCLSQYNLAPLQTRRDIAMLGVIHRSVLGVGPPHLDRFFKLSSDKCPYPTRADSQRHRRQLVDPRSGNHSELLCRSALGLIAVYNMLPSRVVDVASVSEFQSALQSIVRDAACRQCDNWEAILSPRHAIYCHPLRLVN